MVTETASKTFYEGQYDPRIVLESKEFRVLGTNDNFDAEDNIACAYNPAHEIHLIQKPVPKAGKGECIIHVRATGICGSVKYRSELSCMADSVFLDLTYISGSM